MCRRSRNRKNRKVWGKKKGPDWDGAFTGGGSLYRSANLVEDQGSGAIVTEYSSTMQHSCIAREGEREKYPVLLNPDVELTTQHI